MIAVMLIAGLTLLVALYVGELIAPSLNGMVKRLPEDAGGGCEDWLIVIRADRRGRRRACGRARAVASTRLARRGKRGYRA
jgi:hypothetical protein